MPASRLAGFVGQWGVWFCFFILTELHAVLSKKFYIWRAQKQTKELHQFHCVDITLNLMNSITFTSTEWIIIKSQVSFAILNIICYSIIVMSARACFISFVIYARMSSYNGSPTDWIKVTLNGFLAHSFRYLHEIIQQIDFAIVVYSNGEHMYGVQCAGSAILGWK